jgi:alkylation response protein AidB-like acyl-CoA dehydrogenase
VGQHASTVAPIDPNEYRAALRAWLREHEAEILEVTPFSEEHSRRTQSLLHEAGYAGITWPTKYGGQGLTAREQSIFNEEARNYRLGNVGLRIGLGMAGPTILQIGTEEQRRQHLERILRGDEVWCQMFSEPGAGSDLAALQTVAVPDGPGRWLVNGEKVWTSGADRAQFGILLARTNNELPKHRGITMFIIDMAAPGIEVRPIKVATGKSPFCQVTLHDVLVTAQDVIGSVNGGWDSTVTMLKNERTSISQNIRPRGAPLSSESIAHAALTAGRGNDQGVRRRIAELYAYERGLELLNRRLQEEQDLLGEPVGSRGSLGKLAWAYIDVVAARAALAVRDHELLAFQPDDELELCVHDINALMGVAVGGGANQIQQNIIAERLLGLPKDHVANKDVPFKDLTIGTVSR